MRSFMLTVTLSLVGCVACGAEEPPKPASKDAPAEKFDAGKLIGSWKYASAEKGGAKSDAEALKGEAVEITKDRITIKGQADFVFKYSVDSKESPIRIDLEILESPFGGGAKAKGILELKGDDLKLCYSTTDGADAPKKFAAEGDSRLITLKRVKKEKKDGEPAKKD